MKITIGILFILGAVAAVNCFYKYPRYKYEYAVHDPHTQDIKSQWEARDGDNVRGSYSLVEADGSRRVVNYQADGRNGFNAQVHRQGYNHYPAHSYHGMGGGYY